MLCYSHHHIFIWCNLLPEGTARSSTSLPMRWPWPRSSEWQIPTTRIFCLHQKIASPSGICLCLRARSRPPSPGVLSALAPACSVRGLTRLGGKWVSERLLGDHGRLSPFIFASRCFGVCLQRGGRPRRAARLVAVCPRCHPGSVSDPHVGRVEAAAEQGQARLQGRPSSLAGRPPHPLTL